jgi:hypothetical protein
LRFVRYVELACRLLIATVFLGALASKVYSRAAFGAFVTSLRRMAVLPDAAAPLAARLSVTGEALVAVLLLLPGRWLGAAGFLLAVGLLGAFTVAIGLSLRRGNRAPCRCFGVSTTPLGPRHVARNLTLMGVSTVGLAAALEPGHLDPGASLVAGTLGVMLGLLVTALDDIVELVRPSR